MLDNSFYEKLTISSLKGELVDDSDYLKVLTSDKVELLPLLNAAYKVRKKYFGNEVKIHVINNVQNGYCPEDCSYCAQSKFSKAKIETYSMKSDKEILSEAKIAYETGAFRYCMVFSGKGPNENRVKHLSSLIKSIKEKYPIEVCVSPGILDKDSLIKLKNSGLNRLNHNLNTSKDFYGKICTTHNFEQRLNTLKNASEIGLDICSGIIVGMGETPNHLLNIAKTFKNLKSVKSIPINFLINIKGIRLKNITELTPQFCLRVLCLFRFINPKAEIRTAAGRELHLRSLQPLCLYPSNSIFASGYLNARGDSPVNDIKMILDAGFKVDSDYPIDKILKNVSMHNKKIKPISLKTKEELRPFLKI